jgi:hypothetical protein
MNGIPFDDFPTVHSFGVSLRYLSNVFFFQTVKAKRIHQIAVREAFHSALFIEGVSIERNLISSQSRAFFNHLRAYLDNSQKNRKQNNKNSSLEKNTRGLGFKIGNRRSNHYSRRYQTKNSFRLEHEMKGKVLPPYYL